MTLNRLTPSQHYTEKDISPRFWPNGKMPEREDWKQLAKGGFLPHQQPFFPANQPNALRIHPPTFPPQQRGKPPVSKPLALQCQLLQPGTERFPPFIPALPVPMCRPLDSDQPAGTAFRCGVLLPQELHRCSHGLRLYHFFETRSFNITRSSTWSATIRFSFRFSSSRCFSRWASLTSSPPYLAFQLYNVALLIPCCRHNSPVPNPASPCFKIPTICSSVNLLFFTVRLPCGCAALSPGNSNLDWLSLRGQRRLNAARRFFNAGRLIRDSSASHTRIQNTSAICCFN